MLSKSFFSLRHHIFGAIGILLALVMLPSAFASTVLRLDMQSLVANSDQIVHGRVANLDSYIEQDGRVYTNITIDVDEALKGQPGHQVTIRQIGGRTGDLATIVPGMPDFKPSEEVILFLERIPSQPMHVVTGMAQGKFSVAIGPDDKTRFVIPHLGDLHRIPPPASMPQGSTTTPPRIDPNTIRKSTLDDPLYTSVVELNTFKQQIQNVVLEQTSEKEP